MHSNSSAQDEKSQASSSSSIIHSGEDDERHHPLIELSSSSATQHHDIISTNATLNVSVEHHQLQSQQHKTVTPSPHTGQFTFSNDNIDTPSPQPIVDTSIPSTTSNLHTTPSSTSDHKKTHTLSPSQQQQLHSTTKYVEILPHQQQPPTMLSVQPSTPHYQNPQEQANPGSYEHHHPASGNASPLRPYSNIISEVVVPSPVGLGAMTQERPFSVNMNKEVVDAVSHSPKQINLDHVKVRWEDDTTIGNSDTSIVKKSPASKRRASEKEDMIMQPPDTKKPRNNPIAHAVDIDRDTSHTNIDTVPQLGRPPNQSIALLENFTETYNTPDRRSRHPTETSGAAPSVSQYSTRYVSFVQDGISTLAKDTSPVATTASELASASKLEGKVVLTSSSDKEMSRLPPKLASKCTSPDGSSAYATASSLVSSPKGNPSKQDIFTNPGEEISNYAHEISSLPTTSVTTSSIMATATSTTAETRPTPQEQGRRQSQRRNKRKEGNDYRSIIWSYYTPEEAADNCPDTELDLSLLPAHRRPK